MKWIACIGAAVLAVSLVPVEASAAPQTTVTKTVTRDGRATVTRTTIRDRRDGRHGWRWRTHCKTWWHHGRKHRTCRRVRVRW